MVQIGHKSSSVPSKESLAALKRSERQLIAQRCLRVPLAIEWVIARGSSPAEVLEMSLELERYDSSSDVLLEFCFRRIYAALGQPLQSVLDAIAIFESPQPVEALAAASQLSSTCALFTGLMPRGRGQRAASRGRVA